MNDPINPPAIVRSAEDEIVAHAIAAAERIGRASWEVADCYLELSKRGWTQQRIAESCKHSQSHVSKFIACAKKYSPGNNRPWFSDAYDEVNSEKPTATTTTAQPLMCRNCRVQFGKPQPGCKDCPKPKKTKPAEDKEEEAEREPGDDSHEEEETKPAKKPNRRQCCNSYRGAKFPHLPGCKHAKNTGTQNGEMTFSIKVVNEKLGLAMKEIDKLAKDFNLGRGAHMTPAHRGLQRMIEEAAKLCERISEEADRLKTELKRKAAAK